jgi:hypothetical protein
VKVSIERVSLSNVQREPRAVTAHLDPVGGGLVPFAAWVVPPSSFPTGFRLARPSASFPGAVANVRNACRVDRPLAAVEVGVTYEISITDFNVRTPHRRY